MWILYFYNHKFYENVKMYIRRNFLFGERRTGRIFNCEVMEGNPRIISHFFLTQKPTFRRILPPSSELKNGHWMIFFPQWPFLNHEEGMKILRNIGFWLRKKWLSNKSIIFYSREFFSLSFFSSLPSFITQFGFYIFMNDWIILKKF